MTERTLPWRRLLLSASLLYLIYLWPIPAPMTLRQLYLSRSLTEGHLWIDPYCPPVGDFGVADGHCYTTVPLAATVGMPAIAAVRASGLVSSAPGPWDGHDTVIALVPFTALVATLAGAAAVVVFALGLRALGVEERPALLSALVLGVATPLFPYATIAHAVALSQLSVLVAVFATIRAREEPRWYALAGFALGGAVLAEYGATWAVIPLGLTIAAVGGLRGTLLAAAGGLLPLGTLLAYHAITTAHQTRALQAPPYGAPSLATFVQILFGPMKGLFLYWPIAALGAAGLVRIAIADRARRRLAIGLLAGAFTVILLNASISVRTEIAWWGFEGLGPRYSLLAVPCLAWGIPVGVELVGRRLAALALAVSAATSWAGAQASWQLGTVEAPLELLQLGPRLRAVTMLAATLAPGRDAELAGLVAALVLLPAVVLAVLLLWRDELHLRPRRAVLWAVGVALLQGLLALPYLAFGHGAEEAVHRAAARRGIRAEASFAITPYRRTVLARLLEGFGDPEGARDLYLRAADEAPGDADILAASLRGLLHLGDLAGAAALARRLGAVAPQHRELAVAHAFELRATGRDGEARELWRRLVAAHPDLAQRDDVRAELVALGLVR